MKHIHIFLLILGSLQTGYGQLVSVLYNDNLYEAHSTKKYIQLTGISDSNQFKSLYPSLQLLQFTIGNYNSIVQSINGSPNVNLQPTFAIVNTSISADSLISYSHIKYASPYFYLDSAVSIGYSHYFRIKMTRDCDSSYLHYLANKYSFYIEAKNLLMNDWYVCRVDKNSDGDALYMVDLLKNDNRIAHAEPDLLNIISTSCVNDQHFNNQWNLGNTGQHSSTFNWDINMCAAWNVTQGNQDIIVAIVDAGISKNHPDLTNLTAYSYDCEKNTATPTSNSSIFPYASAGSTLSHGTCVAGIVGAQRNNTIGISGIAPNCRLMDIAFDSEKIAPLDVDKIANGINRAWQNNASIINNSWQTNPPGITSALVTQAITNALTKGRNGLGCVVVAAAGNFGYVGNEDVVRFPANCHPDVLVVGALHTDGKIAEDWAGLGGLISHFGSALDILAPGTEIPTTNLNRISQTNNYVQNFNLTSAAAPHVSGVAALILSVNPNLTQRQVCNIIESSARKLTAYTSNYTTASGRSNGTWFNKSGYGMLNAQAALTVTPPPVPTTCVTINVDNQTLVNNTTICNIINSKNTTVDSGSNVFDHVESTNINEGFVIKQGASFQIKTH